MAIFHTRFTPVKKAGGTIGRAAHHTGGRLRHTHGAAGKAAYLAAERIVADNGIITDYRGKFGVEYSELVLPGGYTIDREKFWNAVDAHPTRTETATVARDMIVAFPCEFTLAERKQVARELARWIADRYRVAVDFGMHSPETHNGASEKNYHANYLISERTVSPDGVLGNVQRDFNQMDCKRTDIKRGRTETRTTAVQTIREQWMHIANEALARGGHEERIDNRTYAARGINKTPGRHIGKEESDRRRAAEMTVADTAHEIANMTSDLKKRISAARDTIDEIQSRREIEAVPIVGQYIGSWESWTQDAMGTFIRAMQSADRADARRRGIAHVHFLRNATQQETESLKLAGRTIRRSEQLIERLGAMNKQIDSIPSKKKLNLNPGRTRSRERINQIEAAIA